MNPRRIRLVLGAIALALSAFLPIAADAAEEPEEHPALRDPLSAQVESDADAEAWRDSARSAIAKEDWPRAFDSLRRILESDRTLLSKTAETDDGIVYQPLQDACHIEIAKMPKEARALYRASQDPTAKALWEEALRDGSEDPLRRIVQSYLCTSYGDLAADRLAALALERADPWSALQALRRLRAIYPAEDLHVEPDMLSAREALANLLAGNRAEAEKIQGEAAGRGARATLSIAGEDVSLDRVLARWSGEVQALREAGRDGEDWPGTGGGPSRDESMPQGDWFPSDRVLAKGGASARFRLPRAGDTEGALFELVNRGAGKSNAAKQTIQIHNSRGRGGAIPVPSAQLPTILVSRELELSSPTEPGKVERDRLIVMQWPDQKIQASRYKTGKLVWDSRPVPGVLPIAGAPIVPGVDPSAGRGSQALVLAPQAVLDRNAVYAVLTNPDVLSKSSPMLRAGLGGGEGIPETANALFAWELTTGKRLWNAGREGARTGSAKGDDFLSRCFFLCAPAVLGGRVFVPVYHPDGFHLVCLSSTGVSGTPTVLWKKKIATGPFSEPPPMAWMHLGIAAPDIPPDAAVAADGSLVVAAFGRGIVAAADPVTGQIQWVFKYATSGQKAGGMDRRGTPIIKNPVRWSSTGLILRKNAVFAAPADCADVFSLQRSDGRVRWPGRGLCNDPDRKPGKPPGATVLAGITRDLLVFAGPRTILVSASTGKRVYEWGVRGGLTREAAPPSDGSTSSSRTRSKDWSPSTPSTSSRRRPGETRA
ncbi:MAG: PQQ-binding-like beta-propeller repeat protein [Planctomycetota bacterium]